MTTITFDTHKFVQTLKESGFDEQQAEGIISAFQAATGQELVTKDYLRAEIESAKYDLIKWIAGLLLAQAGLVAALVKLL